MPMTDLPISKLADETMESGESAEVPFALISQLAEETALAEQFAAENGCKLEGTLAPDSTIVFIRE